VNYHFTRKCNYSCGFCFHTQKNSYILPLEEAKKGLLLLKQSGMRKINFAGGEPFLYPTFLGELVKYCKEELKVESVSIVSNASKIKPDWMEKYGQYLDILAVSIDSFNEEVNIKIGREKGKHITYIQQAKDLCTQHKIQFKVNTVVNRYNWEEDMVKNITQLNPIRWKVFKVLVLEGENDGNNTLRDARQFEISDEQFKAFLLRHKEVNCLVPEDNDTMKNSYLIVDEYFRFLDSSSGGKKPSLSILEVGVENAMKNSGYDEDKFMKRGGIYNWQKDTSCKKEIEW